MNNRPLTYVGEELQDIAVTLSILVRGEPADFLENNPEVQEEELDIQGD